MFKRSIFFDFLEGWVFFLSYEVFFLSFHGWGVFFCLGDVLTFAGVFCFLPGACFFPGRY